MDTQRQNRFAWIAVGALGTSTLGMIAMTQLGPLEPPAGAVGDTSPDLSEILSQINGTQELPEFEVFHAPLAGGADDQFDAVLVAPGRIYVESIIAHRASAVAFDGPGQSPGGGRPTAESKVVARVRDVEISSAPGRSGAGTSTVTVRTVATNGLYVSWDLQVSGGFITVVYRPLD